jgi:hypothetical protein
VTQLKMSLSSQSSSREIFSQDLLLVFEDENENEEEEEQEQDNESTDSESENVPSNGQMSSQGFRSSRHEFRSASQDCQDFRHSSNGSVSPSRVRDSKDSESSQRSSVESPTEK